jgi:hypothetical protein
MKFLRSVASYSLLAKKRRDDIREELETVLNDKINNTEFNGSHIQNKME